MMEFSEETKLTQYERQRIENIKRNKEMMAALSVHSKATQLSAAIRFKRVGTKSHRVGIEKKPKTQMNYPAPTRKSLRTRGAPPEYTGAMFNLRPKYTPRTPVMDLDLGSNFSTGNGYKGHGSNQPVLKTILDVSQRAESIEESFDDDSVVGSLNLESFTVKRRNIARIVPKNVTVVRFFPSTCLRMIAAGSTDGIVAFWDVDKGRKVGIYSYHPHSRDVSGISIHHSSLSEVFTSCKDGYIRLMDAEKEVLHVVHSGDCPVLSLSHHPNDANCLFYSEGFGGLSIWDKRTRISTSWMLHKDRINSIDLNSKNPHIMATSSSDRTACIWDLRNINVDKPQPLKIIQHKKVVYSAYFSPMGNSLASTSMSSVCLLNGANYEDRSTIYCNHMVNGYYPSRAAWGWDDSYIFIGNRNTGVDVISAAQKQKTMTLRSPYISTMSRSLDVHPYQVGMLAGGAGASVYLWTTR